MKSLLVTKDYESLVGFVCVQDSMEDRRIDMEEPQRCI